MQLSITENRIKVEPNEQYISVRFGEVISINAVLPYSYERFINYNELTNPYILGAVGAGFVIDKIVVEVLEEFDDGFITIGTDTAQGLLVVASDCDIRQKETYVIGRYIKLMEQELFKVFYNGTTTKGKLRIILLYQ